MTNKELLYVKDALGHEKFLKCASKEASKLIDDVALSTYLGSLEHKHQEILGKFLNVL